MSRRFEKIILVKSLPFPFLLWVDYLWTICLFSSRCKRISLGPHCVRLSGEPCYSVLGQTHAFRLWYAVKCLANSSPMGKKSSIYVIYQLPWCEYFLLGWHWAWSWKVCEPLAFIVPMSWLKHNSAPKCHSSNCLSSVT